MWSDPFLAKPALLLVFAALLPTGPDAQSGLLGGSDNPQMGLVDYTTIRTAIRKEERKTERRNDDPQVTEITHT
jgi:hypothetical protein